MTRRARIDVSQGLSSWRVTPQSPAGDSSGNWNRPRRPVSSQTRWPIAAERTRSGTSEGGWAWPLPVNQNAKIIKRKCPKFGGYGTTEYTKSFVATFRNQKSAKCYRRMLGLACHTKNTKRTNIYGKFSALKLVSVWCGIAKSCVSKQS